METPTTAGEITFSLRISGELNAQIIAAAQKEKRSRQAHIVYSLEKLFADAPTGEPDKKESGNGE